MLHALVLAALIAGVFYTSLGCGFVWDDHFLVEANPLVTGQSGVPPLFTSGFIRTGVGEDAAFYRPLILLSLRLDHTLHGLQPTGYHLTNLVLHICAAVLLYLLMLHIGLPPLAALIGSVYFGLHPTRQESVSWISGRTDIIAAVFGLGSIAAFLRWHSWKGVSLSAMLFGAALLSKESAVVILPILLLFVFYQRRPDRLKQACVLFVPAGIYFALRSAALGDAISPGTGLQPMWQAIIAAPANLLAYVLLLLSVRQPEPYHQLLLFQHTSWLMIAAGWLSAAAVAFLIVTLRKRAPGVSFGLAWFAISILPVTNILPIPKPILAERYLYLPSIGIAIALAAGLQHGFSSRSVSGRMAAFVPSAALCLFAAIGLVRMAVCPNPWANDVALWTRMVTLSPSNAVFQCNLGAAYLDQGDLKNAARSYGISTAMNPAYLEPHLGLAAVHQSKGDFERALAAYHTAARIVPNSPRLHNNLGVAYALMGDYYLAIQSFRRALELCPDYPEARRNLAAALARVASARG